jgi:phospholipase C
VKLRPPFLALLFLGMFPLLPAQTPPRTESPIKTVFIIMMENHNWTRDPHGNNLKDNPDAPYLNWDLVPNGAHAENYWNPPHEHPSLGNYLWLEAGWDFGINGAKTRRSVKENTQFTHQHLAYQLSGKDISWKGYGGRYFTPDTCPVLKWSFPQVFFSDLTDDASLHALPCIRHIRPLEELSSDLAAGAAPRYNFIVPSLCDSMHSECAKDNEIRTGDNWLRENVPLILNSRQYKEGGALFIVWDEAGYGDGPIPMLVLSPYAKKNYENFTRYDHASLLRTVQEIFGVPLLRQANCRVDLRAMFHPNVIPDPVGNATPEWVCR